MARAGTVRLRGGDRREVGGICVRRPRGPDARKRGRWPLLLALASASAALLCVSDILHQAPVRAEAAVVDPRENGGRHPGGRWRRRVPLNPPPLRPYRTAEDSIALPILEGESLAEGTSTTPPVLFGAVTSSADSSTAVQQVPLAPTDPIPPALQTTAPALFQPVAQPTIVAGPAPSTGVAPLAATLSLDPPGPSLLPTPGRPEAPTDPFPVFPTTTAARSTSTAAPPPSTTFTATVSMVNQVVPGLPFQGVGVQMQNFEYYKVDPDRIAEGNRRLSLTRFPISRVMLRAWWYTTGYDTQGKPVFDFENGGGPGRMADLWRVLSFLKNQSVDVVIGEWDDPTSPYDRPALYGKEPNPDPLQKYGINNTDPRWHFLIGEFLTYAREVKGLTNLKWYNLINEPNAWYSNNPTYDTWSRSVSLLLAELARRGLDGNITVIGPDVTGATDWVVGMLDDPRLRGKIGAVDVHRYVDDVVDIEKGWLGSGYFAELRRTVDSKTNGTRLPIIVTEAGLAYGKVNDTQTLRYDFRYGLWMSDYVVQAAANGASGVIVWNADDAFLVGGAYGGLNLKGWGFWNSLANVSGYPEFDFQPRPWFYSFSLLARFMPRGSQPLVVSVGPWTDAVRCTATRSAYAPGNGEPFSDFGASRRGWSWHLTVACVSQYDAPVAVTLVLQNATMASGPDFVSTWSNATEPALFAPVVVLRQYNYFASDMIPRADGFPAAKGTMEIVVGADGGRMLGTVNMPGKGLVVLTTLGSS
ncbi:glycoside hydrolase superfamily [Hyaloraphidium curvatum]|nr:glycoside hydrolase superfamily [Hyaloraphidium curvatum]